MPPSLSFQVPTLESLEQVLDVLEPLLAPPLCVRVSGNLGAGKTTLIAALLSRWQVEGANSPSFAMRNEYETKNFRVLHLDFFRLKESDDALDLLPVDEDYSNTVVFVEWPEKVPSYIFHSFERIAALEIKREENGARRIDWWSSV